MTAGREQDAREWCDLHDGFRGGARCTCPGPDVAALLPSPPREQDARETLREAVERLCEDAENPTYKHLRIRRTWDAMVHVRDLRAALLPSPPATTGCDACAGTGDIGQAGSPTRCPTCSPPATTGAGDELARRFALSAAFRHGWERGAWYVADKSGSSVAAQRAAADKDKRRADSDAYVSAALAASSPPATDGDAADGYGPGPSDGGTCDD